MKRLIQKPHDEAAKGMKSRLLLIASAMLIGMTAFESLKQILSPGITVWESHIITIIFSSAVAVAAACIVIRKSNILYERIFEENRIRRESEEKLRTLITNIPDVMWTSDSTGKTVFISPNFERVSGYPVSEVYEMSAGFWYEGIHPDDVAAVKKAYEELITRNVMFGIEYRFRKKDGSWMWVYDRAVTTYEKDGMVYVDGMFTDITERVAADMALRESEEILRNIADTAQDAVIMVNGEGVILFWNRAAERIFGYARTETVGKPLHTLIIPQRFREEHLNGLSRFRDTGEGPLIGTTIEVPALRKDGTEFPIELAISAVKIKEKWCATGIARDITERKQTEEELTKSRERLAKAQEIARFGDWEWDIGENVVTYSDEIYRIFGMEGQAPLTTYEEFLDVVHPEDRDLVARSVQAAVYDGKPYSIDHRVVWPDGAVRMVHEEGEVLRDDAGRPEKMVGTAQDITERKLAEEEIGRLNVELERKVEKRTRQLIEAQEELVRKEKLSILGQLSGSVGHELRNPLGVMSNAVYFLKMVLADGDETTREYLGMIENEISNSQRIISDLLDFARTKPPQPQPVAADVLVSQYLAKCVIPENVTVTTDIPEALPWLNVDPLQIGQVLVNLITNAVQAMPGGGSLRISARNVLRSTFEVQGSEEKNVERRTLNVEPDADFVEISVADTGEGISPENMKKLFHPLFTTKQRGIGLGLVVCRNLTEANGGRIEVASELGKGTTFTVILPAERSET